ncbi:MAG: hypothetical protein CMO74_06225 [Verrucomicrobiales bacterium]|nr:hypothetical protein [Verrucomicrobiales bacterium]|tara:strand:- start:3245 stop:4300 length:1056 start_codon:yes stop_codon:yes gene_type:complete
MEATKSAEDVIDALRRAKDSGEPLGEDLQDLRGIKFTDADLSKLDLTGCNFAGCEMSRVNLKGTRCPSANFDGATLYKATLDKAEFMGTTFRGANLSECSALSTGFGLTDLTEANFFNAKLGRASFVDAQMRRADFRAAEMTGCRLLEGNLVKTDFTQANLTNADLCETDIEGANFRYTKLRGVQLRDVRNYTAANWIGADVRDVDFTGAYLVRRHIIDENYLHEFRHQSRVSRVVYFFWKWTSDCGRSMTRWGLFLAINALLFAFVYWAMDNWMLPAGVDSHLKGLAALQGDLLPYIYYSVVTFTTLGYGDVSPVTTAGQAVLIVHIAIGYLGLGALLSILANKFASRGQ